jgi:hypothetical protein
MAIACFLLFTTPPFPPFPDRNVPSFLRRITLLTDLLAARPYPAMIASNFDETALGITIAVESSTRDRQICVNLQAKTCTPPPFLDPTTLCLAKICQEHPMLNRSDVSYTKIV